MLRFYIAFNEEFRIRPQNDQMLLIVALDQNGLVLGADGQRFNNFQASFMRRRHRVATAEFTHHKREPAHQRKQVDISHMDKEIADLCKTIIGAEENIAKELEGKMIEMINILDSLAEELQDYQQRNDKE